MQFQILEECDECPEMWFCHYSCIIFFNKQDNNIIKLSKNENEQGYGTCDVSEVELCDSLKLNKQTDLFGR